jgi:hypothetical protein
MKKNKGPRASNTRRRETSGKRQKQIAVTSREGEVLHHRKRLYEQRTGDSGDWGNFLSSITILGLVTAGVYGLAKLLEHDVSSAKVECPECKQTFPIALPDDVGQAIHVICPLCEAELAIKLGGPEAVP